MCFRPKSTSVSSVRRPAKPPGKPPAPELSIDHAVGLFLDSLFARGVLDSTVFTQAHQVRRFLRPALNEPLRTLTRERAEQLAAELAETPSRFTRAPLAQATLDAYTESARRFCRWCVAEGRLPSNPMATGRKTREELLGEVAELRRELEQAHEQLRAAGVDRGNR